MKCPPDLGTEFIENPLNKYILYYVTRVILEVPNESIDWWQTSEQNMFILLKMTMVFFKKQKI